MQPDTEFNDPTLESQSENVANKEILNNFVLPITRAAEYYIGSHLQIPEQILEQAINKPDTSSEAQEFLNISLEGIKGAKSRFQLMSHLTKFRTKFDGVDPMLVIDEKDTSPEIDPHLDDNPNPNHQDLLKKYIAPTRSAITHYLGHDLSAALGYIGMLCSTDPRLKDRLPKMDTSILEPALAEMKQIQKLVDKFGNIKQFKTIERDGVIMLDLDASIIDPNSPPEHNEPS